MNLPARFDHTFRVEVIIAVVVFGAILLVLLGALARSATRRGQVASQKESYKKTEVLYVSAVTAVAAFVAVFSLMQNRTSHPKSALTVNVTGFQWCWRFDYQGAGVSTTGTCVNGDLPVLEVPTGEPITFNVKSNDVIHSMWIPYLRFKLFAYPGFTNSFVTTIPSPGRYDAECAEFCGEYHYAMHFTLVAVPPAQFATWLQGQESGR